MQRKISVKRNVYSKNKFFSGVIFSKNRIFCGKTQPVIKGMSILFVSRFVIVYIKITEIFFRL